MDKEIIMTKYLLPILLVFFWSCEEGADGLSGENGQDGVDGENGLSTILYTLDEPSGDNCAYGGTKIVYGIDVNSDEVLSDSEIDNSTYICNGSDGSDGEDGEDGEVVTDEQHPLVGVWFLTDSLYTVTATNDSGENVSISYDTTFTRDGEKNNYRLIITDENYFHWSSQNWIQEGNYNPLRVGDCIIIDNFIIMTDNSYIYHYEIFQGGNRLKLSDATFPNDMGGSVGMLVEKELWVFERQ